MHAQMFEVALANIVGYRDTLGAAEKGALLDLHEAIRKYEALAMGRQMGQLKKEPGAIDAAVLRSIDDAIQVRNRLMHRFFPEHEKAGDLVSMEGMQRVVDDLAWIKGQMVTATDVCVGITQTAVDNIRRLVEGARGA